MASNINVGIKFTASAGNVPSVVEGIKEQVKGLQDPGGQQGGSGAGKGLEDLTKRAADLGQVGQQVQGILASFSGVLSGAAVNALTTAANFEQLKAKLVSVTGSVQAANEKWAYATKFAAETPFDVKGVVGATAMLEGFGQKAEQVLPAAANLASAMGVGLKDATLVLGKATSGSLEGFESLRNEYAITTNDLQKFGLQVDKTGGLLSKTPEQIEKNRNALLKLIQVRYGDAIERQSQTLNGAFSNLGDSTEQLIASFGDTLIPISTLAARSLTSFVGVFQGLPTGAKAAIAGIVAVGAGVGVMGAGIATAVTGLLVMQSQLLVIGATMAVEFPAAAGVASLAAGFFGTALQGVAGAAGLAQKAMLFLTTTPLGLALMGVAAVAGLAGLAIADMDQRARAAGDSITATANKFQQANTTLKTVISGINEAGKSIGFSIGIVSKSKDQFAELQDAFKKLTPEQLVFTFSKAGESTATLKDKLKALESGSGVAAEKLKLLAHAQELLAAGTLNSDYTATIESLNGYGIELNAVTAKTEDFDAATKGVTLEMNRLGQAKFALQGILAAFSAFAGPLEKAEADSKALGSFLDLSKQVNTTFSLANALKSVGNQIEANSATAGIGTKDVDTLLAKLQDPATSEAAKKAIKEQIALVQSEMDIRKAQEKNAADAIKGTLDAEEGAWALRKAGQDVQLHDELRHVQAMLIIATAGSSEAKALLIQEAGIKKQIREADRKHAEDSLKGQIASAKQLTNDSKAGIGPSVLASLDTARSKVEAWAIANKDLLAQYPKLRTELAAFRTENSMEVQAQKTKAAKEAITALSSELGVFISEATTNTGKLAAVEGAINVIQQARNGGLITEKDAINQINGLTKQRLGLEKAIEAEKTAQQNAMKSIEQANLGTEIQALEARKAAGEKVDKEIEKAREAMVKGQLDQIDREKEAQIQAQGDVAAAEAQAAAKKDGILQAETLRRYNELQTQTKNVDSELNKQDARYAQSAASRSPLKTIAEAFGAGSFSLGDAFSLDSGFKKAPKAPDFTKLKNKVSDSFKKGPKGDAGAQADAASSAAAAGGQVVNDNRSVVVNGADLYGPEFSKAVMDIFRKAKQDSRIRT